MEKYSKKYSICCQACCGTYVETTEAFEPGLVFTDNMFRVIDEYKESFPDFNGTDCPACGAPLAFPWIQNRMTVVGASPDDVPVAEKESPGEDRIDIPEKAAEGNETIPDAVPSKIKGKVTCPECRKNLHPAGYRRHYQTQHLETK